MVRAVQLTGRGCDGWHYGSAGFSHHQVPLADSAQGGAILTGTLFFREGIPWHQLILALNRVCGDVLAAVILAAVAALAALPPGRLIINVFKLRDSVNDVHGKVD